MKSLKQACVPRTTVFDSNRRDTVHDILDLVRDRIDPAEFFAENFVTQGMKTLLAESFKRLEGKGKQSQGVFRLSQSMGGGKTHNLIALGLLCKHPEWREKVMSGFYRPGQLGRLRVVAFSGRQTDARFGIWGEIARQLGKEALFQHYMTHLEAPGQEAWVNLLKGDPLVIMLDELPPYMAYAQSRKVGDSNLAVVTTAALSNLFVAVSDNKLDNVCLVMTDLSGAGYLQGQQQIDEALRTVEKLGALKDLNQEATRLALSIDPVRMNSDEFYHILRTRLFVTEQMPVAAEISEVAAAYAQSLKSAKLMDITTASPEQFTVDVEHAYPFHPAIRDLYARFKENQGFQQTRALIRIMRIVVSRVWNSGKAERIHLIGAHDLDLADPEMVSEIKQINAKLENAIAKDIASAGSAAAEQIDREGGSDAQDVCKLVYLSSLGTSTEQIKGLNRSEIVQYLAAPGRDVARIYKEVIDRLQTTAWYLHVSRDGRLYFKDVQNINAKLDSYIRGMAREGKEKELRAQLEAIFAPKSGDCYQKVQCLPAVDQIDLMPDKVTLVIFRPTDGALETIRTYFNQATHKNRGCFLTGDGNTYARVLEAASALKAIEAIIREMVEEGRGESAPEMQDAKEIKAKLQGRLYMAVKTSFVTLYYPAKSGLTRLEMDFQYQENRFVAEDQVIAALKGAYKYIIDVGPDGSFRNKIENKLWSQTGQEVLWTTVKQRAAQDPAWVWHVPNALDNVKGILLQRGVWREASGYVDRGPFPQPKTDVTIKEVARNDETGVVTLKLQSVHGDQIYMEIGADATPASKRLDSQTVEVSDLRASFLCVDSTGVHETGEPVIWTNRITLKHRFYQDGEALRCELQAAPLAEIRYTTDGSNPATNGGVYSGPFLVHKGAKFALAIASRDGIQSERAQYVVPERADEFKVDPGKPCLWTRRHNRDSTMDTHEFLSVCDKAGGRLCGVQVSTALNRHWAELNLDSDERRSVAQIRQALELLQDFVPQGQLSLSLTALQFDTGQQLLDLVAALKTTLAPGEVKELEPKDAQ